MKYTPIQFCWKSSNGSTHEAWLFEDTGMNRAHRLDGPAMSDWNADGELVMQSFYIFRKTGVQSFSIDDYWKQPEVLENLMENILNLFET